jgi:hypothetical protein
MNSCVFCGATDNLTTSMNVKTSRGVTEVNICTEHEENASPKKVRELVESKELALAEMEAKLKALGFAMVPLGQQGSVVAVTAPTPAPAPLPAPKVLGEMRPVRTESKIIQPTSLKIREMDAPAIAVDKSGKQVNLGKESSYDTTKTVKTKDGSEYRPPTTVESELQTVEVRGVPMRLPKKIVDDQGGRLDIKILPTAGSGDAMKKRFEEMATRSMGGDSPDFRREYDVKEPRPCNFCSGTGKAKIGDQDCPRCKGAGELI